MLTNWNTGWFAGEDAFSAMDQLRSLLDRALLDRASGETFVNERGAWPRARLSDTAAQLVLTAEVPGLSEKDVQVTLNHDVLTLSGERRANAPEGYAVYRQERPAIRFSRSFTLPCAVDGDRTTASVKNGLLTITLEKAKEAQPRQITVRAS